MRLLHIPIQKASRKCVLSAITSASVLTGLALQEDDKPFDVRLSDESFETYELDPPPYTLSTTKKELKQMYYDMVAVRCVLANEHFAPV
jgi:pyruvate dehydrogenase E1 component alpha subunit